MSFLKKLFVCLAVLSLFFAALPTQAADAPAPEKKELEKVTIAQWGQSRLLFYLPLYIAMEKGLFAKNGIDVNLKFAGNDDQIFAAVIGGSADFALGDPLFAAIAHEKGGPGKVVALMITKMGLSGYTNDPKIGAITKPEDLNGLRISSFPEPSTTYTLLNELVTKNKLDTKIVQTAFGAQMAALEAKKLDIAVDMEPNVSIAVQKGYRIVFNVEDYTDPQVITGLTTSDDIIKNKPQEVQGVVTALQEALTILHTQPEAVIAEAKKLFPDLDEKVIKAAIDSMLAKDVYPKSVVIPDDLWQRGIKTRIDSGEIKKPQATEAVVDNRFAENANKK